MDPTIDLRLRHPQKNDKSYAFIECLICMFSLCRNECESFVLALAPSSPHEAFQTFVTTITILLSTDNTTIVETTLYTINHLVPMCSRNIQFGLLNADLVPQLILSLQPLTRSFKYPQNIHSDLLSIIGRLLWLPTPSNGAYAEIDDPTEQQAVHETILKHVLLPSKDYIRQICSARDLFVDRVFLPDFMTCVAQIILICPFYQPTMDYVLDLPLIFTMITSNDFYDNEESRGCFLGELADAQEEWDKHDKELRRIGTIMNRLLRMEGSEDQIEQMLQSVRNQPREGYIVSYSTRLNNLYGMNIPPRG
ncbi:hypothetical protein BLNAU_16939 [Blattamonas nauphoetae]|uniref:Uncharacterized protein n=1 Tax=Blattamonas nauphoetae TaxID=2049346 RepID=A0ABQ9X8X5_9EUKA|nr:hypothetical protein BLNAU_16939 [Blattamonas nauphoetae]